jgi:hypothetical protein
MRDVHSKSKVVAKYRSKPTTVDGIRFASKKEARRYSELKLLEQAGAISDLEIQPVFPIVIAGKPVLLRSSGYPNGRKAKYLADFAYVERDERVVEDVKGMDTPLSALKRALVEAIYGVKVVVL